MSRAKKPPPLEWDDLTPRMLRGIASNLHDSAHDHEIEREEIAEEQGFDVVAVEECIADFLTSEAKRREGKP
jgi:hypothetical protein